MSLKIYAVEADVPKDMPFIWLNDPYFDGATLLKDDDFTRDVLLKIDKATRRTDDVFEPRTKELGGLYRCCLSTGTKTALNIAQHPDKCFSLAECGLNALELILTSLHEGNVLWTFNMLRLDNLSCDVEMNGRHFTHLFDLMMYCETLDIWTYYQDDIGRHIDV